MAVRLLSHELSDLCLGKPTLRSLSITSTISEPLEVLKTSDDNFVSAWSCNHKAKTSGFKSTADFSDDDECRCVGKVCMVDVICYLCKDENLVSPSVALKEPVTVLLPKIPGLVMHVEPSCSSIGLFSPITAFSIDTLGIISPDILTIEYHSPASAATRAISRALVDQTSVTVVDNERTLIGEFSPFTLACCDETVAAALKTLSSGDLMAYIDCGGPPEDLVRVMSARLKERNLNGMLEHFKMSKSSGEFSSSSSSSDEEPMTTPVSHNQGQEGIVEDDCSLVGIVTFSDMLKVFREHLETMA
ncbi:hypothetical protein CRYUN_Cryun38cG0004800 [Craigia yunnanensis]